MAREKELSWRTGKMNKADYVIKAVRLLSEGYAWKVESDDIGNFYIIVNNPDFRSDLGNDPQLVLVVNENEIP